MSECRGEMLQRATASDSEGAMFEREWRIDSGHERFATSSQLHDLLRIDEMRDETKLRLRQAQNRRGHLKRLKPLQIPHTNKAVSPTLVNERTLA